ncbi:MAG: type II toxin-antitoxin system RelB/DinJ family antitoxin [Holophagales bacterium]|jgi:addiction module RelB/DinJ family antitoxin|nr:type II toxin-antitoxin system RelB/DinJ family antitoxin [Holophagales bacterium]
MKPEKHTYYYMQGNAMTQNQTVNVTIELDRNVKESGEALFRSLGMNWSTAISAFVSCSVKQGKIPFEVDEPEPSDFEYSPELEAQDSYFNREMQEILHRQLKSLEAGKYHDHDLIEVGEDA